MIAVRVEHDLTLGSAELCCAFCRAEELVAVEDALDVALALTAFVAQHRSCEPAVAVEPVLP